MNDINNQVQRCFKLALEINQTKKFTVFFEFAGHVSKLSVRGFFGPYNIDEPTHVQIAKYTLNFNLYLESQTEVERVNIEVKLRQLEAQLLHIINECEAQLEADQVVDASFKETESPDIFSLAKELAAPTQAAT